MPDAWRLLTEDPVERAAFTDLAATLTLPATPAAPPNRLRHVLRIELQGRTYYLKCFARTQWKNRLRFALTHPRAADDAARELAVTAALRTAGIGAPRPVLCGRRGPASYYVCAALPGRSLAETLSDPRARLEPTMARAAAEFCGRTLAAGFRLPDLSLDHVFVTPVDGGWNFAVLDLHNGGIARPGSPARSLLRRVLRRFARSARDLPLAGASALRFALRLLRAAATSRRVRRSLLREAPPFGSALRYERAGRSARYAVRNPVRAARERELLAAVWLGRPGEAVLDLPCGTGRLLPFLLERGHRVLQADGAFAMLRRAASDAEGAGSRGAGVRVQADALAMPFRSGAVEGVVMFRFLHHLPPETAARALAEACRIAGRFVVVSFFHPCSVHHLQRRARQLLGAPGGRHAVTFGWLRRQLRRHGFEAVAHRAERAFVRDLWLAAFVRAPADSGARHP